MKKDNTARQYWFTIYCVALVVIGLGIWLYYGNANAYYQRSWTTNTQVVKEKKRKFEEAEESAPASKQPKPPGMRESEIKKYHGHRYDTF